MELTYEIMYTSENRYEYPVTEAFFEFLVLPCSDHTQTLINSTIINSLNCPYFFATNSYGFKSIRLRPENPFTVLYFLATSSVHKIKLIPPRPDQLSSLTLDPLDFYPFLTTTSLTTIHPDIFSKLPHRNDFPNILEMLMQLNTFLNETIKYEKEHTTTESTAMDVWNMKYGVCQDFAHLFIAICRLNKIPCRYVGGYLDQGTNYLGAARMHAWVEAFLPGYGWLGFDPANNMLALENHIKVCHGQDYKDCSPIKGVLMTKGTNTTEHQVKVAQQQ